MAARLRLRWILVRRHRQEREISRHVRHPRGGAGALLNFKADLEILLKNVPPDFQKLDLSSALTQHWIDGKDFKLRLYTERNEGRYGAVEFVVDTKVAEEGEYKGSYSLSVESMQSEKDSEAKRWKARGKIACSAE